MNKRGAALLAVISILSVFLPGCSAAGNEFDTEINAKCGASLK